MVEKHPGRKVIWSEIPVTVRLTGQIHSLSITETESLTYKKRRSLYQKY